MKTQIILLLIILSVNYSCNRQNNCDKEINDLKTVLEYTHEIYHHHTKYLTATELRKNRFSGKQLLNELSAIDSITSEKENLDNIIDEVTLVSSQFDLGFRVELDSFLIQLNKEFYFVKLTKTVSLKLILSND